MKGRGRWRCALCRLALRRGSGARLDLVARVTSSARPGRVAAAPRLEVVGCCSPGNACLLDLAGYGAWSWVGVAGRWQRPSGPMHGMWS